MSYDKTRAPSPFRAVAIPDLFCPWIGKIAVTWSFFENALDNFILALSKASGGPAEKEWMRQNFKKRSKLFRELAGSVFSANPELVGSLVAISIDAGELQWKRNFLLHGRLRSVLKLVHTHPTLEDLHIEASLFAKSRHNGKELEISFDEKALEDLFYGIAHVSGRLEEMSSLNSHPPKLTSDDIFQLRAFLVANHPSLPTPNTPPPQPQSSGG
jgi:hypothetical protein